LQQIMWGANTTMSVVLLALLSVRKNYRAYPAFTFYIFVNLALSVSLFAIYRRFGFYSKSSWLFAWGMTAATICARATAVAEVCKHVLSRYTGIWALAQRLLLVCAGLVLLYSGVAVRYQWKLVLPIVERGLELAIATVVVVLFLFARYYGLRTVGTDRSLAIGFCLYSCFRVLNDTILYRYLFDYAALWSLVGTLAYFAALSIWAWALRKSQTEAPAKQELLPLGIYQSFAPQINLRLQLLNDHLGKIWNSEVTRH
jgi:hypothetical protein